MSPALHYLNFPYQASDWGEIVLLFARKKEHLVVCMIDGMINQIGTHFMDVTIETTITITTTTQSVITICNNLEWPLSIWIVFWSPQVLIKHINSNWKLLELNSILLAKSLLKCSWRDHFVKHMLFYCFHYQTLSNHIENRLLLILATFWLPFRFSNHRNTKV